MQLINDPIPHLDFSLDDSFYEYCKTNWVPTSNTNHELRYNTPITNRHIIDTLDKVVDQVIDAFMPILQNEYPKWNQKIIGRRYQFGGNLMSPQPYKMRDWHLDNGNKVIIGLWYFKHPDDSNDAGLHISNGVDEAYIPYSENRVVFIPNLTNSWHKVGDRKVWTHERRFINMVIETDTYVHDYLRDGLVDTVKPVKNLMI